MKYISEPCLTILPTCCLVFEPQDYSMWGGLPSAVSVEHVTVF